uniref:Uncharacterized protein n=1 Tax=Wuchereria bancrofti TaxID=6293 RepID=A0AAF5PRB8_WUCBA
MSSSSSSTTLSPNNHHHQAPPPTSSSSNIIDQFHITLNLLECILKITNSDTIPEEFFLPDCKPCEDAFNEMRFKKFQLFHFEAIKFINSFVINSYY